MVRLNKGETNSTQKFSKKKKQKTCFKWKNFLFFKYPVAVRDFDITVGDRVFHIQKGERGAVFDHSSNMEQGCWVSKGAHIKNATRIVGNVFLDGDIVVDFCNFYGKIYLNASGKLKNSIMVGDVFVVSPDIEVTDSLFTDSLKVYPMSKHNGRVVLKHCNFNKCKIVGGTMLTNKVFSERKFGSLYEYC